MNVNHTRKFFNVLVCFKILLILFKDIRKIWTLLNELSINVKEFQTIRIA